MYSTFKYFDKKGRRLSVFCRYVSPLEAEMFTLTCSHSDPFKKKTAREYYESYINGNKKGNPTIELVTIQPEEREIKCLLRYCRDKFYKKELEYVGELHGVEIYDEVLIKYN